MPALATAFARVALATAFAREALATALGIAPGALATAFAVSALHLATPTAGSAAEWAILFLLAPAPTTEQQPRYPTYSKEQPFPGNHARTIHTKGR